MPGEMATFERCALCGAGNAAWMHGLNAAEASFRVFGREWTWASELGTCERCEQMYRAGDDEGLAAVHPRHWDGDPGGAEEAVRNALGAFRRADLGAVPMADWLPPGVVEAASEGFLPVENLTGADYVVSAWPDEHRRAVLETRSGRRDDTPDGRCWLLRSPWPSIAVQDVFVWMWEWQQERRPRRSGRVTAEDRAEELALLRDFLRQDESTVLEFRRTHRRAGDP